MSLLRIVLVPLGLAVGQDQFMMVMAPWVLRREVMQARQQAAATATRRTRKERMKTRTHLGRKMRTVLAAPPALSLHHRARLEALLLSPRLLPPVLVLLPPLQLVKVSAVDPRARAAELNLRLQQARAKGRASEPAVRGLQRQRQRRERAARIRARARARLVLRLALRTRLRGQVEPVPLVSLIHSLMAPSNNRNKRPRPKLLLASMARTWM